MDRILFGPIPEPDDLFGREVELAECKRILATANILLLAPRRFGKSGIMRYFLRRPGTVLTPLWLHLEDIRTEAQFAGRLLLAIRAERVLVEKLRKTGTRAGKLFNRLQEISVAGVFQVKVGSAEATSWTELAGEIVGALEEADQPILFLWDELPSMLRNFADEQGLESTRTFLGWFRSLRLDGNDNLRRHRFIVAGSTGLNYLLDRRLADPDLVNDLHRLSIGPLERPNAIELCRRLAEATGFTTDAEAVDHLLQRIGQPVPYFIQLFFAQAEQVRPQIGRALTVTAIDRAFATQIVGAPCKAYFDQYRRRLKRYPPAVEAAVVEMLAAIAVSPCPLTVDDLHAIYAHHVGPIATRTEFAELLADLECDWYLTCDPVTARYSFYMAVVRDWWARWYRPVVRRTERA